MNLKNFFKKNKKALLGIFAVAVIFLVLAILVMPTALAQQSGDKSIKPSTWTDKVANFFVSGLTDALFKPLLKLIEVVSYAVFYLLGLLLALAGALLDFVLTKSQLNQFTGAAVVQTGWGVARNTANMFFALILLIISFATILRVESYGIKQVLPRLIIAALLINFSLTIGGVIIDFTQVLTKYFVDQALSGTSGSLTGTIANKLGVAEGLLKTSTAASTPPLSDSLDGIAAALAGLFAGSVVILIATFTFFAAAIFFVIRYIALLFLLILAPLAWFFFIIPGTRNYWNMWWNTFFKWAFFAPAYAFFLYLSMELIKRGVVGQVGVSGTAATGSGFGRYSIPTIVNFTIIIGFLLGSLIVAQKLGIWGAGSIIKMGKSAGRGFGRATGRWAARGAPIPIVSSALRGANVITSRIPGLKKLDLAAAATKYEARKAAAAERIKKVPYVGAAVGAAAAVRKILPTLFVPAVWKRAMASSRARAESQSFAKSAGYLEGLLKLDLKEAKMRQEQADAMEVDKKESELKKTYKTEEAALHALDTTKDPVERQALLRIAASMNAMNTYFASDTPTHKPEPFDPDSFRNFLQKLEGMSDDARAKIASDISSIASSNGNFSLVGMTKWDPKENKEVFADAAEQTQTALTKALEMEFQQWARQIHPDSFFKRGADGKFTGDLHTFGAKMIQNISGGHIKQVDRLQGRTLNALYEFRSKIRDQATAPGVTAAQGDLINKFAEAIEKRYEGKP